MRRRMTWNDAGARHHRASAHPATPDEGPASPAYGGPDPDADAYETGDTSSWAEDVHPGPYTNSAHPATPDEGPASPAYKAAALNRKAAKCIKIASAMLGRTASVADIEDQALALMDLSDRQIAASLARIAQDDDDDDDDDTDEVEVEVEEDDEDDVEESAKKKASSPVERRIARLERVLTRLAADDEDMDEDMEESAKKKAGYYMDHDEGMDDDMLLEEMLMDEGMDMGLDDEDDDDALLDDMLAEEAMMGGGYMDHDEGMDEGMVDDMLLEEMLLEEGMFDKFAADATEEAADATEEAADDEEAADKGHGKDASEFGIDFTDTLSDPMGVTASEFADDDEMVVLAKLFGKDAATEAEEDAEEDAEEKAAETVQEEVEHDAEAKKASRLRPQPKRPSNGASKLGGVSKEASTGTDLSDLWESAPDVSKFF